MSNLIYYNPQQIGVVVNALNGDIFATNDGYEILSRRSKQTVTTFCQKYGLRYTKPGDIVDAITGKKLHNRYIVLIPSQLVLEWLILHNREQALIMGCKGAAVYLYGLAGFRVKVKLIADVDSKKSIDDPDKSKC